MLKFETDRFSRFREILLTDFKNTVLRKTRLKFHKQFQTLWHVFTNMCGTSKIIAGLTWNFLCLYLNICTLRELNKKNRFIENSNCIWPLKTTKILYWTFSRKYDLYEIIIDRTCIDPLMMISHHFDSFNTPCTHIDIYVFWKILQVITGLIPQKAPFIWSIWKPMGMKKFNK